MRRIVFIAQVGGRSNWLEFGKYARSVDVVVAALIAFVDSDDAYADADQILLLFPMRA